MKLNEWLKSVGYDANENMIPPPMSAGTAATILADELLGGEACSFSVPNELGIARLRGDPEEVAWLEMRVREARSFFENGNARAVAAWVRLAFREEVRT